MFSFVNFIANGEHEEDAEEVEDLSESETQTKSRHERVEDEELEDKETQRDDSRTLNLSFKRMPQAITNKETEVVSLIPPIADSSPASIVELIATPDSLTEESVGEKAIVKEPAETLITEKVNVEEPVETLLAEKTKVEEPIETLLTENVKVEEIVETPKLIETALDVPVITEQIAIEPTSDLSEANTVAEAISNQ